MVSHPQGTQEGAIAEYDCNDGFILNGFPNRQCLSSGVWSGVEPICTGKIKSQATTTTVNSEPSSIVIGKNKRHETPYTFPENS